MASRSARGAFGSGSWTRVEMVSSGHKPQSARYPVIDRACFRLMAGIGAALIAIVWVAAFGTSLNPMLAWLRLNNGPLQAVAAFTAIGVSALVAWWVPYRAALDRRRFLKRASASNLALCADAIGQMARLLFEEAESEGYKKTGKGGRIGYDLSHYRSLLLTFPAAELADHEIQSRMLRMQNCLVRTEAVADWYNNGAPRNATKASEGALKIYRGACGVAEIEPLALEELMASRSAAEVPKGL